MSTGNPASASNGNHFAKWSLALHHLTDALDLLDEGKAPPEIGAQLDQVISGLRAALERSAQKGA